MIYVATSNPGKLRDFAAMAEAGERAIEFLPLPELEQIPPPAEDALTFAENAREKAIAYSGFAPKQIVLADDSGLEVDALQGAPGVRSARYAEDAGFTAGQSLSSDARNNLLLIERLRGISAVDRTARYRCCLAAARDGACIAIAEGTVEGVILEAPRGEGGFGYDPLFYLPDICRTMAEIDLVEKSRISHRANALRKLLEILSDLEAGRLS
ncbi:MAG TPA: non-canonical purine NTP pyrophosphatase [Acidobacteriaceae bacterium]|nr:non-canonical purine NTP pyrophosphatase [Acidobacteriaceae bacterium]